MAEPLDVVFLPSADHEHDVLRAAALARTAAPLARLWIVGASAGAVESIGRVLAERALVPGVVGEGGTAALNRALLLCDGDVLILPPGVVPELGCIDALVQAA